MALTVWFYEHTHGNVPAFVYDPSFKLVNKDVFPRVLKWGTRNYKHEGTYKSLLNVNGLFQSLSCLEPVSNEEALLISPLEEGSTPKLAAKDREIQQLREQVPFTHIMPIRSVLFKDVIARDVINPDHIDVEFDSIGGLEAVKQALIELVIIPLKRPKLFVGQLLSPQKGVSEPVVAMDLSKQDLDGSMTY
ncbi:hypothetical protein H6P81_013116 [Aristolochia fimbriata]|uniref:Uncharacterized protein n=1 Tax=Aristolochia fimbriata TaxID=158543 RepID=A0AAV7EIE2_ARIFI|nr:hypothetical protein H6P81_013116 [Aristolochia fimbriata]